MQDSRDMVLSLAVMAVLMVVFVGTTGLCSYHPGRPENGPVQEVDADAFVQMEASRVPYPVVLPDVPEGWVPNSARASVVAEHQATIIGFVTTEGDYIQLLQTDAPIDGLPSGTDARIASGTVNAGGAEWTISEGVDDNVRRTWTTDAGKVRYEIQGSANDDEYRTLAEATLGADPVAKPNQ
nr:DUF4245 domain-containing protein [Corynebacterium sp. TAE3-ERU12]